MEALHKLQLDTEEMFYSITVTNVENENQEFIVRYVDLSNYIQVR